MITICAVICGADNWVDIENYGQVIAIDGKSLRSADKRVQNRGAIQLLERQNNVNCPN